MVHSTLSQTITKLPPTSALCTFHFLSAAFGGDRQKVGWETEREGEVRERERERETLHFSLLISAECDKIQSQAVPPKQPSLSSSPYKGLATQVAIE